MNIYQSRSIMSLCDLIYCTGNIVFEFAIKSKLADDGKLKTNILLMTLQRTQCTCSAVTSTISCNRRRKINKTPGKFSFFEFLRRN